MAKKYFIWLLCVVVFCFLFVSCGTDSGTYSKRILKVEVGMTKTQVINIMGEPSSRSVNGNHETWRYWNSWNGSNASVDFTDGRVTSMHGN